MKFEDFFEHKVRIFENGSSPRKLLETVFVGNFTNYKKGLLTFFRDSPVFGIIEELYNSTTNCKECKFLDLGNCKNLYKLCEIISGKHH